jgi:hypothetical protein
MTNHKADETAEVTKRPLGAAYLQSPLLLLSENVT